MEFTNSFTRAQSAALETFFENFETGVGRIEAGANCIDLVVTMLDELKSACPADRRRAIEYVEILYLTAYSLRNVAHELDAKYARLLQKVTV